MPQSSSSLHAVVWFDWEPQVNPDSQRYYLKKAVFLDDKK